MSGSANSCSVLSRLGRLLHHYKPAQPALTPRYTHHIHTAAREPRSDVLDSIQGLFSRHIKRFIAYRTPPPPLPAAASGCRLPTSSRRWYCDPWKVAAAVLLPCAAGFTALGVLSHHETVPYTNRAHRVMLSPSNERKFGNLAFDEFKKKLSDKILPPSDPRTIRVHLIAADVIRGVHRAFPTRSGSDGESAGSSCNVVSSVTNDMWVNQSQKQGNAAVQPQTGHLGDLSWEVIVVKDNRVNAYSLPGGKIVVHTGCLNYLKTDAEIATLIAHEVGHVVARHFFEVTKIITLIPAFRKLFPFSRRKEMEADLIGMMLLAAAGYDPRVAPRFYLKLGEIIGDSAWKDYIGAYPSGKKRSQYLLQDKVMGKALELHYKQVCAGEGVNRHFPYGGSIVETLT